MHIHPNQINPNAQLDALCASEKAAAKVEAARTRKKLLESTSKLAGEAASDDAYVLEVDSNEESQDQAKPRNQPSQHGLKKQEGPSDSENGNHSVSDWA